eukprot:CAMPEP_0115297818 /NCGR_PEP_ID=MMETSP0270-20121206/67945_1 /TAXON_ID=71861 /ORGANISM="Scrippsiella trochoidea, Strain CCMP3099" /LENGTH=41 /DNA_ID= /DNA_START= /DNA_END= /DNA_ORIENTATION=
MCTANTPLSQAPRWSMAPSMVSSAQGRIVVAEATATDLQIL